MRQRPDEVHTERLRVAPGVFAYVDKANARILKFGALVGLVAGIIGGTALLLVMEESREPFIVFAVGYGISCIAGWLGGLIFAAARASRTAGRP